MHFLQFLNKFLKFSFWTRRCQGRCRENQHKVSRTIKQHRRALNHWLRQAARTQPRRASAECELVWESQQAHRREWQPSVWRPAKATPKEGQATESNAITGEEKQAKASTIHAQIHQHGWHPPRQAVVRNAAPLPVLLWTGQDSRQAVHQRSGTVARMRGGALFY